MFDPERDQDTDRRHFYRRLLVVALITVAGCAVLWPSVTGFAAGPDHLTDCLAVTDGWHGDKPHPSDAAIKAAYASYPPIPTEAQRSDPAFMARFRARLRAIDSLPVVQQGNAYANWVSGPGACVHESRHRLIVSGIGLAGLAGFCGGVAYFCRTRTRKNRITRPRSSRASDAGSVGGRSPTTQTASSSSRAPTSAEGCRSFDIARAST